MPCSGGYKSMLSSPCTRVGATCPMYRQSVVVFRAWHGFVFMFLSGLLLCMFDTCWPWSLRWHWWVACWPWSLRQKNCKTWWVNMDLCWLCCLWPTLTLSVVCFVTGRTFFRKAVTGRTSCSDCYGFGQVVVCFHHDKKRL